MQQKFSLKKERRQTHTGFGPNDGFTIVELLVVLAIIGLVAGLVAPRVINYLSSAKAETARVQIKNIKSALELYYLDIGSYPSAEAGLSALSRNDASAGNWNGPYLKNAGELLDPWGKPYIYQAPQDGGEATVKSLGRDGKEGGSDVDEDIII